VQAIEGSLPWPFHMNTQHLQRPATHNGSKL